jgi:uncharacterized protein (DUF488 family)
MYYRRKIVLSLLQMLDNQLNKVNLQKLLFLYSKRKKAPEYEFIPYKYGCYSYSLKADLNTMVKKGQLSETDISYTKEDKKDYLKSLKIKDREILSEVVNTYGKMSKKALTTHTYLNFPFYAINSTIAEDLLPEKYLAKIDDAKPTESKSTLFTIGYEGISLEKYLGKLIKNNIKLLIDVRKNPLSMKFGFSKSLLQKYCNSLGIEYVHYPEVGIASDKRKNLKDQVDYDSLFKSYRSTTLKNEIKGQEKIIDNILDKKRVALTCFEAEHCQCHRSHLANSIAKFPKFKSKIVHL